MKTIIAGSREGFTYQDVFLACEQSNYEITEVVSGTARGVDQLGEEWARLNQVPVKKFPADWNKNGKAAGPIRNRQMAEYVEALIALWDGKSRGTKNMIDEATKKGLKVYVYRKTTNCSS